MREVKEETGLDIEDVQFLTATETFFESEGKHYVTIFMTAFAKKGSGGEIPEPTVSTLLDRPKVHQTKFQKTTFDRTLQLMEPDKCEGWSWHSFREMREMNEATDPKPFLPLRNLMVQRPAVCAALENEEQWIQ